MRREIGHVFHDRSGSWEWNGRERWLEIEIEVNGYNGRLGYWVTKRWRWNNSEQILRTDILTLTPEESDALDDAETDEARDEGRDDTGLSK